MDFGLGLGLGIVIGLFMAGGLFVLLEMMERPRPPTSTQPSGPISECTCSHIYEEAWRRTVGWWHLTQCPYSTRPSHPTLLRPSGAGDTSTTEGRQS